MAVPGSTTAIRPKAQRRMAGLAGPTPLAEEPQAWVQGPRAVAELPAAMPRRLDSRIAARGPLLNYRLLWRHREGADRRDQGSLCVALSFYLHLVRSQWEHALEL